MTRTVPEKIRDFLCDRTRGAYCDDCLQQRLGIKWRQQVQTITATLAVTGVFVREYGTCATCNEQKQVIHAVPLGAEGGAAPPNGASPQAEKIVKELLRAKSSR